MARPGAFEAFEAAAGTGRLPAAVEALPALPAALPLFPLPWPSARPLPLLPVATGAGMGDATTGAITGAMIGVTWGLVTEAAQGGGPPPAAPPRPLPIPLPLPGAAIAGEASNRATKVSPRSLAWRE